MQKVFFDTDIILDVATARQPFCVSSNDIIHKALYSDFSDFEDAVQNYTAETANADCIVTRNKKDYSTSSLQVFLPDEFLAGYKI